MLPTLSLGPLNLPTYALAMLAAFGVALSIRRREAARLGHVKLPGYRWVAIGALLGAAVGAKLGMVLFTPLSAIPDLLAATLSLDFTGKTVIGGLVGGYLGVEIAKAAVGIRQSTGDAFAVALPVGQAIGRVGCLLHGCCYGAPWDGPWAIGGRHPAPLYEAGLDLLLAAWLWRQRRRPLPQGHLFRRYLVGYALIRAAVESWRGDPHLWVGPLTLVQAVCLLAAAIFSALIWRGERRRRYPPSASRSRMT